MASMVIRNIPDDVYERLKQRAKADGKSAEELVLDTIAEKARPEPVKPSTDELLRIADEIRARTKRVDGFDIVGEIRAFRDS